MKWEKVKLSEVTEYITDGDHQPAPKSDSGVLFVKIKDIQDNRLTFDNALFVPQEYYNRLPKNRKAEYGDTLYTVVGSYGIPAFVNHNIPFCFERNIALLHPNNRVIPKYLYYAVNNPIFYGNANNIANGSAQKLIPLSKLAGMEISVPPIERQETIVNILSAYDDLIENNQKQIKLLEEAAQRLYKEWFIDLRFPGHENVKIVDGVPEGWERMVLSEVTSILKRGISPKYSDNGKYSVINQKCIRSSIMDISESRRQEKEYVPTLNLQDSDTVICSTGTGTLGRVGRVYGDYPNTTFDSHVTLVRAKENPNYIYHVVKSQQEYLMGMGRGSTNQQELYRDVIERLVVLCPSQDILLKAERVLNAIHCKIKAVYLQNNLLVESRDRLLPKLMSGEIEV
jgi:restriction modification system DNA specificity domain protein